MQLLKNSCLSLFIIVILLGASLFNPSIAQKGSNVTDKVNHIDSLLKLYSEYKQFNGAVLVAKNGEAIYKQSFGYADLTWDVKNTVDTKFRLASVSKQFTAMLTMQLVSQGVLELYSPVSSYLPDYPKKVADSITIHQLLTHTSGLPNYTSFPDYRDIMRQGSSPEKLVQFFSDSTLQFSPGERFSYSNSGYALLGYIMETISGQSFAELLDKQIFEPLGMKNSGYAVGGEIVKNLASGYDKNGTRLNKTSYINMSAAYTAGGIYSTVEDLLLWDQALYNEKLLPKKYRDMLFEKHTPAWREYYGYGWILGERPLGKTDERVPSIEHDGVINGFTSLIVRIPSTESTIILLNNTGGAPLNRITNSILGILNEKPYDFPRKSIAIELAQEIRTIGLEKAMLTYENIKNSNEYYMDENDMNIVGYDLLESEKLPEAEAIFRINVEAHPHSSNVHDSYGEVLLKLGKEKAGIESYKKSIEYNPNNQNGKNVLMKLGFTDEELNKLTLELLKSNESWTHEIFHFPLRFASEIPYLGREDARFPPGWRKPETKDFWSYVIAWYIEDQTEPRLDEITKNIELYFDGLMDVVNKEKDRVLPKTVAKFRKSTATSDYTNYEGTIDIHDSFVTRKAMRLNVTIQSRFIKEKNKSLLIFRFSPKDYDHEIWKELNEITVRKEILID